MPSTRHNLEFKTFILKSLGYNPENTFAMWDYRDGLISEREMWRIINRNIGISNKDFTYKWSKYPRVGDMVILNWIKTGEVDRVTWEDGQPDLVWVAFRDGDYEDYEYETFKGNRITIGGPNQWYIEF